MMIVIIVTNCRGTIISCIDSTPWAGSACADIDQESSLIGPLMCHVVPAHVAIATVSRAGAGTARD